MNCPPEFQTGHVLIGAGSIVLVARFLVSFLAVLGRPGPRRPVTQAQPMQALPDVSL